MVEQAPLVPQEAQGKLEINIPVVPKELSEQEFTDLANRTFLEFGKNVIFSFYGPIRRGEQKEPVGEVSQRPGEKEIVLEAGIEHAFVNACQRNGLPVIIIGEHHNYISPSSNGHSIERKHIALIDAADDTSEYIQGLPAPLWTVVSIYSLDGKPVAAINVNLKERKMHIARDGKNYLLDLETGVEKEIKPSERTSIKDKGFCIVTYLGQPKYALSGAESLSDVLKEMITTEDSMVQPHSGAFGSSMGAEGATDALVMIPSEPLSEFLPGWVFAQNAGFTAYTLNLEDGTYKPFEFDLNVYKNNPDAYRKEKIPNLLVVRSSQIRDELTPLLVKAHKEIKLREAEHAFAASRPKEFELFRAPNNQAAAN